MIDEVAAALKSISSFSAEIESLQKNALDLLNKNKELEERIDELLKVNRQLKENISSLSGQGSNVSSIQFYKEQILHL